MKWAILSPHFDDAVLSCGGYLYERVQAGDQVEIWTICAGDPPPGPYSPLAEALHQRWQTGGNAVAVRRQEDRAACRVLGARAHPLDIPDCIYRRDPLTGQPLIKENEDLFQPLLPVEIPLVHTLASLLAAGLTEDTLLVCPLTMGNHIDHHLTRAAAEMLSRPVWYYPDYPYLVQGNDHLGDYIHSDWIAVDQPVSPAGLAAWQSAVAAHESQISTFWGSLSEMRGAISDYWGQGGGSRLWGESNPLFR